MKKIILIFIITTMYAMRGASALPIIPAVAKSYEMKELEKELEEVRNETIQIKDNKVKYNQLKTEYKTVASQYQNLIDLCKKRHCTNETKKLYQNFGKLKKSIEVLDGMMEVIIESMNSLKMRRKVLKEIIKANKQQNI